tara:strand:+ start:5833 stop:6552 length:720 start_codon:yes stop_codon:yes gene_type:complete
MGIEVYIVICLGIFAGFFIQTVIGFAGALISLPILLLTVGLHDAMAYISIFYMYSSVLLISKEWKNINKKIIIKLIIGTVLGVGIGVWVLSHGKPLFLKKALGIFILLYVVYSIYVKNKIFSHPKLEFVFGLFGGFFSGLFSTGGPLYVIVVKNSALDMRVFRATMFGVLGLVTITRIPILYIGGILNLNHVYYSLFIIPFFLLALYLGKKMYLKLNETTLKRGVLVLLFISGVMLTVK